MGGTSKRIRLLDKKNILQMNLLFFQNCISPHQIPYIRECINDERVKGVYLIVPRIDYDVRKNMGWDSRNLLNNSSVKLFLKPSDEQIIQLLKEVNDPICLFSGIRADVDVFHWFKLSLNYDLKRGIITEPPNVYPTKPLFLHYLRFLLQDYKYVKYIHYVFAFGDLAVNYYRFWSKKWQVIPFAYCTDNTYALKYEYNAVKKNLKIIFVGSLTKNKNVISILKALSVIRSDNISLDIVGDGKERKHLENFVFDKNLQNVFFHGSLPMKEVFSIMNNADVLILPSHYDGWGAVVNEALQLGLYVMCSNNCGSKALIVNEQIGLVFRSYHEFFKQIQYVINNKEIVKSCRPFRKQWANSISGRSLSKYLIDKLCNSDENIVEPWKKV